MVDNLDFYEGFIQGYRSIKGSSAATPATPAQPATPANKTPFQVGIIKGIERAVGLNSSSHLDTVRRLVELGLKGKK